MFFQDRLYRPAPRVGGILIKAGGSPSGALSTGLSADHSVAVTSESTACGSFGSLTPPPRTPGADRSVDGR